MSEIPVKTADAVALRDNDRKLFAQYVTGERQKWRDRIRELAIETVGSAAHTGNLSAGDVHKLMVIRAELKVRLNLGDDNDKEIIKHIEDIIDNKSYYGRRLAAIKCFEDDVSWLLKEDWERVKHETRPLWHWWHPLKKVDRVNKKKSKEYQKSEFCLGKKICIFGPFLFFVLILVFLLTALAPLAFASYANFTKIFNSADFTTDFIKIFSRVAPLTPQKTPSDNKENVEESSQASCNGSAVSLKSSKSTDFQILPNITVSLVIINESNKEKDNEKHNLMNSKFKKCMEK